MIIQKAHWWSKVNDFFFCSSFNSSSQKSQGGWEYVCTCILSWGWEGMPWEGTERHFSILNVLRSPFPAFPLEVSDSWEVPILSFLSPSLSSALCDPFSVENSGMVGTWVSRSKAGRKCFGVRTGSWGTSEQVRLSFLTGLGIAWGALSSSAAVKGSPCLDQQREVVDKSVHRPHALIGG